MLLHARLGKWSCRRCRAAKGGPLLMGWLLMVAGTAAQAQAQQVYTCVDARGARSLQDRPCASSQREAAVRVFKPVVPASMDVVHVSRRDAASPAPTQGQRASTRSREGLRRASTSQRPDACASARDKRQSTLDRVGLKRTYDLLQRLDASVQSACVRR